MNKCVIISAGEIHDYQKLTKILNKMDYNNAFFIVCDGGLAHAGELGIKPDIIVGDFDSCTPDDLSYWKDSCEVIQLPREKDDTDTFYAVKLALERGYDDFLLLGSMGARFDHAFANVSILIYLEEQNKKACIIDDYSVMRIVGKKPLYVNDNVSYFSLLAIAGQASGINISGAKYPLKNASLKSDFQLGISNEVLKGCKAEISVEKGYLLLVEVM